MNKDIEVEVRGLLSREAYQKVRGYFEKHAKFLEEKERMLIDYSTFLPDEGLRDRKKDIRVRVTNGIPEIVVKLGSWGGSESRKELSFKGCEGEFETLVEIFGQLGFQKGIFAVRKTLAYEYKGVEFALVEVPNHSYYFEAEKMAHGDADFKNVEGEIRGVCREIGLEVIDKEGFFEYIEKLNKEANEVFDFNENKQNFFKNRFEK